MPQYVVKCSNDESHFENLMIISYRVLQEFLGNNVCPVCGAKLTQKYHAAMPQFNGSGFHKTDYGK